MFRLRLRELREINGFKSQQAFADAFGVAQSTVGGWEAGKREPNFQTAIKLADFFHVSVGYLLGTESACDYSCSEKFRERLAEELSGIDPADFYDVADALDDYRSLEEMANGRHPLSLAEACVAADKLHCSMSYMLQELDEDTVFADPENKKASPISDEALTVAQKYLALDDHGKEVVDMLLAAEAERMENLQDTPLPYPDNVIPLQRSRQPACAGTGFYLGPEEMDIIHVLENELTRRADFCVPVSGDSMEPLYHDGDLILVQGMEDIHQGQIGVFTVDGDGFLKRRGDGVLHSLNPAYQDVPVTESTWCNGLVIGVLDPAWVVKE